MEKYFEEAYNAFFVTGNYDEISARPSKLVLRRRKHYRNVSCFIKKFMLKFAEKEEIIIN